MSETPKDWSIRVDHMISACEEIQAYTKGLTAENFLKDLKTVRSVERCFTIIGELPTESRDIQQQHPSIEWSDIIGMRHVITHDYDRTRDMIIWSTFQNKLPDFRDSLKI
ncbi:MAG: HepT-like ribonuclease domain-containing protein [Alphaproteobacteria bacterium]